MPGFFRGSCNFTLKLPDFKDLRIKSIEKLVWDESIQYSNSKTEISVEDFNSDLYEFLLPILNTFTSDTKDFSQGVIHKVNEEKALENLCHNCTIIWRFEIANYIHRFI